MIRAAKRPDTRGVTLSLPADLIERIAEHSDDLSGFVRRAIRGELLRIRQEELLEAFQEEANALFDDMDPDADEWDSTVM